MSISSTAESYLPWTDENGQIHNATSTFGPNQNGYNGCAHFVTTCLVREGKLKETISYVPTLMNYGTKIDITGKTQEQIYDVLQDGDVVILRSMGYADGHVGIVSGKYIIHNPGRGQPIKKVPLSTFHITGIRRFGNGEDNSSSNNDSSKVEIPVNDKFQEPTKLEEIIPDGSRGYNIRIITDDVYYKPVVLDNIKWTTVRVGSPAKLEFEVLKDDKLKIKNGSKVIAEYNGKCFFRGILTTYKYSKNGIMSVTAYDPIFYLIRSKETYNFKNKSADEIIKGIACDYQISFGHIDVTGYRFETLLFDNKSLLDIMLESLEKSVYLSKKENNFCLYYDPKDGLTLKSYGGLLTNFYIDESNYSDYSFESSIEKNSYNKIKVFYNEPKAGEAKKKIQCFEIAEDKTTQKDWGGILQLTLKADSREQALDVKDPILKLYDLPTKTFSLKNVQGNIDVRAGMFVMFKSLESNSAHYVRIEEASHTIKTDIHLMDLRVKYKEVYG